MLEGKNGMFKLSMARHGEDFFNQINFVKSSITLAPLPKRTTIVVFFRIYFRKSIDFGNNQPEC